MNIKKIKDLILIIIYMAIFIFSVNLLFGNIDNFSQITENIERFPLLNQSIETDYIYRILIEDILVIYNTDILYVIIILLVIIWLITNKVDGKVKYHKLRYLVYLAILGITAYNYAMFNFFYYYHNEVYVTGMINWLELIGSEETKITIFNTDLYYDAMLIVLMINLKWQNFKYKDNNNGKIKKVKKSTKK